MNRKRLLTILFLFFAANLFSQDNYIHIPKTSSYIVTIRPLASNERGTAESLSRLEMFGNSRSYNDDVLLYGTNSLEEDPRTRLTNYLTGTISSPALSGVDSTRNIYAFHEENDTCSYWAYIFPVGNELLFTSYLKINLFAEGATVKKEHGFSSITQERVTAGWTNNYAIVLLADYYHSTVATNWYEEITVQMAIADSTAAADAAMAEYEEQNSILTDSAKAAKSMELEKENQRLLQELEKGDFPEDTSLVEYDSNYDEIYGYNRLDKHNDTLHDTQAFFILNRLMNLEYESSIAANKNFRALQNENFEAAYWYNYGLIMQQEYLNRRNNWYNYNVLYGGGAQAEFDTLLFPTMWENSYVAGLVTFNDTITTMEHRISVGEQMSELTTGMYRGKVDRQMLNYVKADNLMSMVCLSVNMEKFLKFGGHVYKENLRYSGMGMFEQTYLAMWEIMRVFIDDNTLYDLFNGQFVFAVTDLKPVVTTYVTYEYDDDFNHREVTKDRTEIVPEFVFMAGVGRKKDMQKILDILEKTNLIKKVNEDYYMLANTTNPASQVFIVFRKGMLMFTNNEDLVNNHLKKGYKGKHRLGKKLRKLARKSPLVAWWDGRKTFDTYHKINKDEDEQSPEENDLEKNVSSGTIIGKKGKRGVHRIIVSLTMPVDNEDKKQGSLDRFFHVLNGLFLITR